MPKRPHLLVLPDIGRDAQVNCQGCSAPCCTSADRLVLIQPGDPPLPVNTWTMTLPDGRQEAVLILARHPVTQACVFLGPGGACTIYDRRPKICRSYDCRLDDGLAAFAAQRFPPPKPSCDLCGGEPCRAGHTG